MVRLETGRDVRAPRSRIILLASCLFLFHCTASIDSMMWDAESLSGDGSTDCGIVQRDGLRSEVNKCLIRAFESGGAAFAGYLGVSLDSNAAEAIAVRRDGAVWILRYDDYDEAHIRVTRCVSPQAHHPNVQPYSPFDCDGSLDLSYPRRGNICVDECR